MKNSTYCIWNSLDFGTTHHLLFLFRAPNEHIFLELLGVSVKFEVLGAVIMNIIFFCEEPYVLGYDAV
jgi:hypothetical protein